ncbi:hypothetical protein PAXRUDRAFT_825404 [Paxillus rubicundulus Ve08.2h10]|uniref:Unplaced genomic scaffold scaffold_136, whole genome shotgun sequence n=1 Tax=Paxillus rubicundulus Ve08.2h10 TaxID=930991 RepID=A0A0D0EAZ5_9AGAM|nr:hypothetical protein PAXRUDRAFT_825404 [Paxillus rubicundulus Ve08.2h10]
MIRSLVMPNTIGVAQHCQSVYLDKATWRVPQLTAKVGLATHVHKHENTKSSLLPRSSR